ncbi:MAG: hypothetical protein KW788_02915 [Candidatus Doudnabacteria bacterium]|nr:hypothetical protein [Candidatus Doudnabacteria bacterium]
MDKIGRTLGYIVVVLCFVSSAAVLLPWKQSVWGRALETVSHTYDFPALDKAQAMAMIAEASQRTLAELPNLSMETVYNNFMLVNKFRGSGLFTPYPGLANDPAISAGVWQLGRMNVNALDAMPDRLKIRAAVEQRRKTDPEFLAIDKPTETVWHWDALTAYAADMLPFSTLFALAGLIGLLRLWGLAKFVNVAGCTLSFLLSVTGGAIAQTVKKAEGDKKKKTEHLLQLDLRDSSFLTAGSPPDPNLQFRVSLYEKRWFVETVNTTTPRQKKFYSEVGGGVFLKKTSKTWLLADAFKSENQNNDRSLILGSQFYRFWPRITWAFPVLRYEHGITGPPTNTFAVVANPLLRFVRKGRFGLAPDVNLRKTLGKPRTWTAGLGFKLLPGRQRSNSLEVGLFRNWQNQWSVRARSTINFAF